LAVQDKSNIGGKKFWRLKIFVKDCECHTVTSSSQVN